MSSPRPRRLPVRTYSKRVLRDSSEPPLKKPPLKSIKPTQVIAVQQYIAPVSVSAKKRSIEDYFRKPSIETKLSSSDTILKPHQEQEHTRSSSPPLSETPPSSPPPPEPTHSSIKPPKRPRRRLTTRPQPIQVGSMHSTAEDDKTLAALTRASSDSDSVIGSTNNTITGSNRVMGQLDATAENKSILTGSAGDNISLKLGEMMGGAAEQSSGITSTSGPRSKSVSEPLIPRKRRLTIKDSIVEGGLKPNVDPSIANRIIFNADGSIGESGNQDQAKYVVSSESVKGGVRFIETTITEDTTLHPCNIPITTNRGARERDTDSEASINIEASSRGTPSPTFPIELDTEASTSAVATDQTSAAQKKRVKTGKLIQTQINLGQNPLSTCTICKFAFNQTVLEDVKAHMKFHDEFLNPFLVAKLRFDVPNAPKKIKSFFVDAQEQYIVAVDNHSPEPWKKMAEKVSNHVSGELNSHGISSEVLWSTIADPGVAVNATNVIGDSPVKRYKAYLYVEEQKVVAFLLAERVTEGLVTHIGPLDIDEHGQSIPGEARIRLYATHTDECRPALLGVHYIWTHKDYRNRGFASRLMDAARHGDFVYGVHIRRDQTAWTPTTDAGRDFAGWYLSEDKYTEAWDMIIY